MNKSSLPENVQKLITDLAADLKDSVAAIEASPATTQNHYGRYGALLSQLSKGNRGTARIIALALMEAGANQAGVKNGLALFV